MSMQKILKILNIKTPDRPIPKRHEEVYPSLCEVHDSDFRQRGYQEEFY